MAIACTALVSLNQLRMMFGGRHSSTPAKPDLAADMQKTPVPVHAVS